MRKLRSPGERTVNMDINSVTHNPIIAEHPTDSFNNIYAVLSVVRELVVCNDIKGCGLEGGSAHGMYLIMNCVMDALHFEMEQRKDSKT